MIGIPETSFSSLTRTVTVNPLCVPLNGTGLEDPIDFVFFLDHTLGLEKVNRLRYLFKAISCEIPSSTSFRLMTVHLKNIKGPEVSKRPPFFEYKTIISSFQVDLTSWKNSSFFPHTLNKMITHKVPRANKCAHMNSGIAKVSAELKVANKSSTPLHFVIPIISPQNASSTTQSSNAQELYKFAPILQQYSKWLQTALNRTALNDIFMMDRTTVAWATTNGPFTPFSSTNKLENSTLERTVGSVTEGSLVSETSTNFLSNLLEATEDDKKIILNNGILASLLFFPKLESNRSLYTDEESEYENITGEDGTFFSTLSRMKTGLYNNETPSKLVVFNDTEVQVIPKEIVQNHSSGFRLYVTATVFKNNNTIIDRTL
uniref:Protein ECM21 n=1 Tax=Heterorhabditis bacteriophora TaxID=37862 RepID=A0A1I7X7D6_HETBA